MNKVSCLKKDLTSSIPSSGMFKDMQRPPPPVRESNLWSPGVRLMWRLLAVSFLYMVNDSQEFAQ
ncbi:hypothetical protein HanIR_Chr14g0718781 [Helianthus annuus]|nr:hypothetical protein HanIR_Chr14g0718781 [Helianthus annuus]